MARRKVLSPRDAFIYSAILSKLAPHSAAATTPDAGIMLEQASVTPFTYRFPPRWKRSYYAHMIAAGESRREYSIATTPAAPAMILLHAILHGALVMSLCHLPQ